MGLMDRVTSNLGPGDTDQTDSNTSTPPVGNTETAGGLDVSTLYPEYPETSETVDATAPEVADIVTTPEAADIVGATAGSATASEVGSANSASTAGLLAKAAGSVDVEGAETEDAVAASVDTPGVADATDATASTVTGGPTEMSSAQQLANITSQDSPLMQIANNQGMLSAARRGLGESTIAGAASQAEMVKKATPFAQQDAATATQLAQSNADRETQVSSLNAQLGTDVSKFNAEQLNEAERLAAQMETAVSQGNAEAYNAAQLQLTDLQTRADLTDQDLNTRINELNATLDIDVSKFNAAQKNEADKLTAQLETAVSQSNAEMVTAVSQQLADLQARADLTAKEHEFRASAQSATERNAAVMQTQALINDLNKQLVAGSQAVDLAQIQGQYNVLIAENQSASSMFDSFITGLSSIMSNEDIDPARVTAYVNQQTQILTGSLQFMQDMNDLDLEDLDFTIPPVPDTTPTTEPAPVETTPVETTPASVPTGGGDNSTTGTGAYPGAGR